MFWGFATLRGQCHYDDIRIRSELNCFWSFGGFLGVLGVVGKKKKCREEKRKRVWEVGEQK